MQETIITDINDGLDSDKYERYKKFASFISKKMPERLLDGYKDLICQKGPEKSIKKKYKSYGLYITELTFEDIIAFCFLSACQTVSPDEAQKTFFKNRRIFKRNWLNVLKDELNGTETAKNPKLLRRYAEAFKNVNRQDKRTIEEIMQTKYKEVQEWRADDDTLLMDFFFIEDKSNSVIANSFIIDVTLESLKLLVEDFGSTMDSINVNYPTNLTDAPIFGYRNSYTEFVQTVIDNEVKLIAQYDYDVDIENQDFVKGSITSYQVVDEESRSMVTQNGKQITVRQKQTDTIDASILTLLFSRLNGSNVNEEFINCSLRDLARKVYQTDKPWNKLDDLSARLKRLRSTGVDFTLTDTRTNKTLKEGSLGFLTYVLIDRENDTVSFTLSQQMKSSYIQKQYISIISDEYYKIESSQTRSLMMILQQERLSENAKGVREKTLSMKYFRSHLQLPQQGNKKLADELTRHFQILQDKGIVIESFEMMNRYASVHIVFLPLSAKERMAYDIPDPVIEGREIIDKKDS